LTRKNGKRGRLKRNVRVERKAQSRKMGGVSFIISELAVIGGARKRGIASWGKGGGNTPALVKYRGVTYKR